ncbi:MAG: hypothetical protein CM15mV10_0840 [uncultured marine virus]|nr:MAG: hypothetical protein CM15mV10_0840 [uncultured marine virus]
MQTLKNPIPMGKNDQQTRHNIVETGVFGDEAGLSKSQIRLLKEGPQQLAQAWLLGAMHQDYDRMKGIKRDYPKENKGQMQSSLKDFFLTNVTKAFNYEFRGITGTVEI